MNWPTPAARDWRSDSSQMSDEELYGTKGRPLARTAEQWPTPTSLNFDQSHQPGYSYSYSYSYNKTMEMADTLASSLPDRPRSTVGEASSKIRRTLNPLFVEWLMGWPPGWTLLALTAPERAANGAIIVPASNGCGCSATALSAWKRRMRSALLSLGLPPEAAPAQLGLFQ